MALTEEQREDLIDLANNRQLKKLKEELTDINEVDIAELLGELPPERALVIFRLLPKDLSSEVFACENLQRFARKSLCCRFSSIAAPRFPRQARK